MPSYKSKKHLSKETKATILSIVRKYNLKNAIKGYSKLRKAELVTKMWKHRHKWNIAQEPDAKPKPIPQKRVQPRRRAKTKHRFLRFEKI